MAIELLKALLMFGLILYFYKKNRISMILAVCIGYTFLQGLVPKILIDFWPIHIVGCLFVLDIFRRRKIAPHTQSSSYLTPLTLWLLLLIFLMFIYGWMFPWPDTSGARGFNQQSEGRSIIFTVGMILQIFAFIYFSQSNIKKLDFEKIIQITAIVSTICALFTFLDYFGFEIYNVLNPFEQRDIRYENIGRTRGINGEPRTNAQILVFGIFTMLVFKHIKYRFLLMAVSLIAFYLSMSLSGVIVLVIAVFFVFSSPKLISRNKRLILLAVPFIAIILISSFQNNIFGNFSEYLSNKQNKMIEHETVLEVFDDSAVSFFKDNPEYILFGVGPGLISLPASNYISPYAQAIYGDRIDSIPHMWIIQVVSNTGLVGLALFGLFFYRSIKLIRRSEKMKLLSSGSSRYAIIVVFLYVLQVNPYTLLVLSLLLASKNTAKPIIDK
jgi:hypothetical protein